MAELIVALNGIEVGVLTKENSGALSFRYKTSWLNTQGARPVSLSLPIGDQVYVGEKVFKYQITYTKTPTLKMFNRTY